MGYARSPEAFQRAKKYLDLLKVSTEPIVWTSLDVKKLQYIIHNGLYVANYLKIPGYEHLKYTWKVQSKGKHIIATPLTNASIGDAIVYTDIKDPFVIVDKLSKLIPTDQVADVIFESCDLTIEDYVLVRNWCQSNNKVAVLENNTLIVTEAKKQSA